MAARHDVLTFYNQHECVEAGGLMSNGTGFLDAYPKPASIGRTLKGEKPGDLPVQQATKVELFINLKTAKTLGITVPLPLSGRADELIEIALIFAAVHECGFGRLCCKSRQAGSVK